ncbi:MAG: gliding motility protein GldB [Prevotella sp.]|nr:gliding motility protein GldB [Prevotella sp.]
MRKLYIIFLLLLMLCIGCQWHLRPADDEHNDGEVTIERYDRVEGAYLTLADYGSLNALKTDYPIQTRTLIENVLQLGLVNDPEINNRLLVFFQDSTLQEIIKDVNRQYASVDDLNILLTKAFNRLTRMLPNLDVPTIYTQISSLDQSIVVSDSLLGISLDKYLGADYPVYLRYGYSERQRNSMTREYIVPDCLGFYLLSRYPMPASSDTIEEQRHWHMLKIQYVVNQAMDKQVFTSDTIKRLERYVKNHPGLSTEALLMMPDSLL